MDNIKYVSLILLFMLLSKPSFSQGRHHLSVAFTPALTEVNINNFTDFSISGYTNELFLRQRPNIPDYESYISYNYSYRLNKHWSLGIGFFKAEKKSNSGEFYLYETSKTKTIYYHTYNSLEFPLRLTYRFSPKRITPIVAIEIGPDIFKKFYMSVYSINNQTNERNNSLTETHYGIKQSLVRVDGGILAGARLDIFKFLSLSLTPEFRYYSNAFRVTKCPECSSFIAGNMWMLGLRTEISVSF